MMQFTLDKSIQILERTPAALRNLLDGISEDWTTPNEGGETWSVFDVMGHLIHAEQTDWMNRIQLILSSEPDKTFQPLDRFAQFTNSKGKSLTQLLTEFQDARKKNLNTMAMLNISVDQLALTGKHPAFGEVTLKQLIATWVAHDLNHLSQISRVMAKQYQVEVGPWIEYLRILKS